MTCEILSVKEYAARQGMTEQAVYKQIRAGKLLTVERQENGKAKKYIFVFAQEGQGAPAEAAGAFDHGHSPGADLRAATLDPYPATAAEAQTEPQKAQTQDQTAAALDKTIAALTAQLEEKDSQLRERDRQINRLTELLSQSQQLQAHSQKLLEQNTQQPELEPVQEPETAPPQEKPEPRKRRSFWEWLESI